MEYDKVNLCGWHSTFERFYTSDSAYVIDRLQSFVENPGESQIRAWKKSVPWLQKQCQFAVRENPAAYDNTTILEYELPRDFRRPDVVVLDAHVIAILELKGQNYPSQGALDQVLGYVRDLKAYHSACADRELHPVLVIRDGPVEPYVVDGVSIVGPDGVHELLANLRATTRNQRPISPDEFLAADAYAPLPTIVQAARDLFHARPLPFIKRARAATEPAITKISEIAHTAAGNKSRHLVLIQGVPGAGKTLVGLQAVHAGWLDDLSVPRHDGQKQVPAVYLSGNGPLVAVLQDALKRDGARGSTFVQDIKKYVAYYQKRPGATPPEHLIVFDEAQRAHDAERVAYVHKTTADKSEPEHLVEFVNRIPAWSVLVGLIGSGQAIHVGEEGGMDLWVRALSNQRQWTVHGPPSLARQFKSGGIAFTGDSALDLDTELRFHLTPKVHSFVDALLADGSAGACKPVAKELHEGGHRFLITRDLELARQYLRERYKGAPLARYGILASSKDKMLPRYGVDNTFQTTKRLKVGDWYNSNPNHERSCCQLNDVATEFSSQGLELDFSLLAWGSDFLFEEGQWSIRMSRGTRGTVHDPLNLRRNVYRVLLTRGRDGTVVFIPPDSDLDCTYYRLVECGFRSFS